LDIGDEDATGPTGGAERLQPTTQTFEVDQARVNRIKGDRVAPAQGRQHLGPSDPQIFSLSTNADGTVGATGQVDLLDFRTPAVHKEEVAGRSLPDQQPEGFARLDRSTWGATALEMPAVSPGGRLPGRGGGGLEARKPG